MESPMARMKILLLDTDSERETVIPIDEVLDQEVL
jgi:hypothetical protein